MLSKSSAMLSLQDILQGLLGCTTSLTERSAAIRGLLKNASNKINPDKQRHEMYTIVVGKHKKKEILLCILKRSTSKKISIYCLVQFDRCPINVAFGWQGWTAAEAVTVYET